MATIFQEFYDANSHRRYPLDDSAPAKDLTGVYTIPDSLMTGMTLCVPYGTVSAGTFYISSIVVKQYTIDIGVSYKPTAGSEMAIGYFLNIDTTAAANSDYSFTALPQAQIEDELLYDITGSVTIGSCDAALLQPGAWEFDSSATALNAEVLNEGLTQIRSVQVGTQRYYGNIVLKEGDNVSISASYDATTNTTTLTFSSTITQVSGDVLLNSDADILQALTDIYGRPVTRINNLPPSDTGDFSITGLDCCEVTGGGSGVSLSNPCSQPCCDNTYLTAAYDGLNQMNIRYSRLIDFYNQTSSNIANLNSKMALLEVQTGFF